MKRSFVAILWACALAGSSVLAQDAPLARFEQDLRAMETFRPGYAFWQHVFTVADGKIAFGSATDGHLIAVFPRTGDWTDETAWIDSSLTRTLEGRKLPTNLDERRDLVASLLKERVGPVVHNPTRGLFVLPNARQYGGFIGEWARIYERFGVPPELGLAQALVESGLSGTRRSEARAVGFCQFLETNLRRLNQLAPYVIEGRNQTAQAPYCAAYLTILATKYGSYIPALSEHHSGGTNVGRTLINGERLGGGDVRHQYFAGSLLARELRQIDLYGYRDIYRTYGPRSYSYAEMVFGNMANVRQLMQSRPQEPIYAMRAPRALRLADIVSRTRMSADEIRRFNPALVRQVPAQATLYLPVHVKDFGPDVAFWRRPAGAAYSAALADFFKLESGAELWDDRRFEAVLRQFQQRFRATNSEEGTVMATMLGYVMGDAYSSRRREILAEFRASDDVRRLFEQAVRVRDAKDVPVPGGDGCSPTADVQLASGRGPC